jgi:6-phosphogluconolactonase
MSGDLIVLSDAADLARHVSEWLIDQVAAAPGPVRVALSGGSTPKAMFQLLATEPYAGRMQWDRLHLFWGDERFVAPDHPDSNYGMTRSALLSKVPIPAENIHPMPTDGAPDDAARRYESLLQSVYGRPALQPDKPLFDITFLGLGEDGHTASLIPGEPVLLEHERWVAAVAHGRPEARITLTYSAIDSSACVAFLVSGSGKRDILARARSGDAALPAAHVKPVGKLLWFVDQAAAGK